MLNVYEFVSDILLLLTVKKTTLKQLNAIAATTEQN